jgi:hypothetical protein
MNLHKVFENNASHIEDYTYSQFNPDHLTLFVEDVQKGTLRFNTVNKVIFHFFQIPGWYFQLSEFNRTGNNTGWLISSITKANDKEKVQLENYIYDKHD